MTHRFSHQEQAFLRAADHELEADRRATRINRRIAAGIGVLGLSAMLAVSQYGNGIFSHSKAQAPLEARPEDRHVVAAILQSGEALSQLGICASRLSQESLILLNRSQAGANDLERQRYFEQSQDYSRAATRVHIPCPDTLPEQEYQIPVNGQLYNVNATIIAPDVDIRR